MSSTPVVHSIRGTFMSGGEEYDPIVLFGADRGVIAGASEEYQFELRDSTACSRECPAGVNVKAYINLIANRRFEEAVEVIREMNPFPIVCGRVCTRPCEEGCEQGDEGDPLAIRALKRFASDYELARRPIDAVECEIVHEERVAIIGSGPAGLTAAVDLIRLGYPVTVFELSDEPGGMLRFGIPANRLPKRILKREIDWITDLGVELRTGERIGDPAELLKEGYSAVLIAAGAQVSVPLGIEGEDSDGVIEALTLLRRINCGEPVDLDGKVVVIGGGSTAFDAARSALRVGAGSVTLAYRRGREEMPAEEEEIDEALEEGVLIRNLAIPGRIVSEGGKVVGIELIQAELGEPDDSGRRRPVPIEGSEFIIDADHVVPAIGARPDIGPVGGVDATTDWGTVCVDEDGGTSVNGVFAAGDVELGPSTVVESIGRGHTAAGAIVGFLGGGSKATIRHDMAVPVVLGPFPDTPTCYEPDTCSQASLCFEETSTTMSEHNAVTEATRCVSCGPCHMCELCLPTCESKQVAGRIDGTEFLLKVPSDLSRQVHDGLDKVEVSSAEGSRSMDLGTLTVSVDEERCIGCGLCEEACAYRAIGTVLRKGSGPVAVVDHDACASCSACVSACPTGAISQGRMSDDEVLGRISMEVVALSSFWNGPDPRFDVTGGVIDLMAEFKPTVSFLLRALMRAGKGVVLIGPDDSCGPHYITRIRDPGMVVYNARRALAMVGISPDRIAYRAVPHDTDPAGVLSEFARRLDVLGLGRLDAPVPTDGGPLAEALDSLRSMASVPEIPPMDPMLLPPAEGGTGLFEACIPLYWMVGSTDGLFDMQGPRASMRGLVSVLGAVDGSIALRCPSRGLKGYDGGEVACERIEGMNIKAAQASGVSRIVVASPEAYNAFSSNDGIEVPVMDLPGAIEGSLGDTVLDPLDIVVAVHPSCAMDEDPFLDPTLELLGRIPGVRIVTIDEGCGRSGFRDMDAGSRVSAHELVSKALEMGADTIACTSSHCQAHMLLMQRQGSWRSAEIEVTDVYSLLLRSIRGEGA